MHFFEFLYYLGLSARKFHSFRLRNHLPCRVISIGNITTGGTGKTPAAISIAQEAIKRGLRPVVLTRGYRGRAKGPCFVTKGAEPLLSAKDAGDEPRLMAERLKDVPVVKGADRYRSGLFALEQLYETVPQESFIFILDDGFQHWKLHRDKDIVLVDAANPFGGRQLLPFGRLREPLTALGRADIIVISKADGGRSGESAKVDAVAGEIRKYNPEAPIFFSGHRPVACRLLSGERKPPAWISGKRVYGFCGLGNPGSFKNTVASLGGIAAGYSLFRDHHGYTPADVRAVSSAAGGSGAEWIVTTEKDIIRTKGLDLPENIVIIEVEFSAEAGFYEEVFRL